MEIIMTLILEEVIMLDRNMSDGRLYLLLQLFSTLKKNINSRLDSFITDYVLLIFIVIPL